MHYEGADFEAFTAVFFDAGGDSDTGSHVWRFSCKLGAGALCAAGGRRAWLCGGEVPLRAAMYFYAFIIQFALVFMLPDFCQTGVFAIGAVVVSAAAVWYLGKTAHAEQEQTV